MRTTRSGLTKQMTDVVDEIIAAVPVDDGMPALVSRIGKCVLEAAAEEQASYMTLLAAASAEIDRVSKERAVMTRAPVCTQLYFRE